MSWMNTEKWIQKYLPATYVGDSRVPGYFSAVRCISNAWVAQCQQNCEKLFYWRLFDSSKKQQNIRLVSIFFLSNDTVFLSNSFISLLILSHLNAGACSRWFPRFCRSRRATIRRCRSHRAAPRKVFCRRRLRSWDRCTPIAPPVSEHRYG